MATEQLISGPAGTGKSLACLLRLFTDASQIPNLRCLICRKTRVSLTESALVTLERDVMGLDNPLLADGVTRAGRRSYVLPNRSEIIIGGLNDDKKIMSTEWDRIYVQEAIELDENQWEALTTRLSRVGLPGLLLADTNPDRPTHWLKRRCDTLRTRMHESRHEDNPILWDQFRKGWTDAGRQYIAILDALTGPRKQRLRHGRWVQAEGVVYEDWNAAVHLVDRFVPPPTWPIYLAVDFGYVDPFVCQFWVMDPDGRLYLWLEIYHSRRLVEDHCRQILEVLQGRRPRQVISDSYAEDRATMERHLRMRTTAGPKGVCDGIQAVAGRLRTAADGYARLFIMRDATLDIDPELLAKKQPTSTAEEMDGYVWNVGAGRRRGEEPLGVNDHGMDAMRYVCAYHETKRAVGIPRIGPGPAPIGAGKW